MKSFVFSLCIFCGLSTAIAQHGGFGKERKGDANPFRFYYFSYDLSASGVHLGPELDFLWAKLEKVECETGTKLVDKKLLFVPNFGAVFTDNTRFNLYAGLELDYRVIYHKGGIFELFAGAGYTRQFGNGLVPVGDQELEDVLAESQGFIMPTFGLGTGYDFRKGGADLPVVLNLRVLTASLNPSASFFNPSVQVGITYGIAR